MSGLTEISGQSLSNIEIAKRDLAIPPERISRVFQLFLECGPEQFFEQEGALSLVDEAAKELRCLQTHLACLSAQRVLTSLEEAMLSQKIHRYAMAIYKINSCSSNLSYTDLSVGINRFCFPRASKFYMDEDGDTYHMPDHSQLRFMAQTVMIKYGYVGIGEALEQTLRHPGTGEKMICDMVSVRKSSEQIKDEAVAGAVDRFCRPLSMGRCTRRESEKKEMCKEVEQHIEGHIGQWGYGEYWICDSKKLVSDFQYPEKNAHQILAVIFSYRKSPRGSVEAESPVWGVDENASKINSLLLQKPLVEARGLQDDRAIGNPAPSTSRWAWWRRKKPCDVMVMVAVLAFVSFFFSAKQGARIDERFPVANFFS